MKHKYSVHTLEWKDKTRKDANTETYYFETLSEANKFYNEMLDCNLIVDAYLLELTVLNQKYSN